MLQYIKLLLRLILFGIAAVAVYVSILYALQIDLTLWPRKVYRAPAESGVAFFAENPLKMSDGSEVMTWYAAGRKDLPAILFFHGNAHTLSAFAPMMAPLAEKGHAVLMMEYRGFGKTSGTMRQERVFKDAAETYDWLAAQGYEDIAVYGYSFGCAVAVGLTAERNVSDLILTAPFASLSRLVKEKPVPLADLVLQDKYKSEEIIRNYTGNLLIIHGREDRLIPYHHAEILYNNAGSLAKKLVLLENEDHISVFLQGKNIPAIVQYLQKYDGAAE